MKVLLSILFTCLFLLIGIGGQYIFSLGSLHFENFSIFQWMLQSIYIILIICTGVYAAIMATDDNIAM